MFEGYLHSEEHHTGAREAAVASKPVTQEEMKSSGTLSDINKAIQKLRQGEMNVDIGHVLRKDNTAGSQT